MGDINWRAATLLLFCMLMAGMGGYFRHPLTSLPSTHSCSSFTHLCVTCPTIQTSHLPSQHHLVTITHHYQFIVIWSANGLGSQEKDCRDYMVFLQDGDLKKAAEQVKINAFFQGITISTSHEGQQHLSVDVGEDTKSEMIVLYHSPNFAIPAITVQNSQNINSLSLMLRTISTSIFLTLLIRCLSPYLQWLSAPISSYQVPSLQNTLIDIFNLLVMTIQSNSSTLVQGLFLLQSIVMAVVVLKASEGQQKSWAISLLVVGLIIGDGIWENFLRMGITVVALYLMPKSRLVGWLRVVCLALMIVTICLEWKGEWWWSALLQTIFLPCLILLPYLFPLT